MKYIDVSPEEIIDRNPDNGIVKLEDGRQVAGRRIRVMAESCLDDVKIEPVTASSSILEQIDQEI